MEKKNNGKKSLKLVYLVGGVILLLLVAVSAKVFLGSKSGNFSTNYLATESPSFIDLKKDETINLNSNDIYKADKYSITDSSVATLDDDGNLKGIKEGETTLTLTNGDEEKTITIRVDYKSDEIGEIQSNDLDIKLSDEDDTKYIATRKNKDVVDYRFVVYANDSNATLIHKTETTNDEVPSSGKIEINDNANKDHIIIINNGSFSKSYTISVIDKNDDLNGATQSSDPEKEDEKNTGDNSNPEVTTNNSNIDINETDISISYNLVNPKTLVRDYNLNYYSKATKWTNKYVYAELILSNDAKKNYSNNVYYKLNGSTKWIKGNYVYIENEGINKLTFAIINSTESELDINTPTLATTKEQTINIDTKEPQFNIKNNDVIHFKEYNVEFENTNNRAPISSCHYGYTKEKMNISCVKSGNNWSIIQTDTKDKKIFVILKNSIGSGTTKEITLNGVRKINVAATINDGKNTKYDLSKNNWVSNSVKIVANSSVISSEGSVGYQLSSDSASHLCKDDKSNLYDCKNKWLRYNNRSIDANGISKIRFAILDKNNNPISGSETDYYTIKIDKTSPTLSVINPADKEIMNESYSVTINNTSLSGINKYYISKDNGKKWEELKDYTAINDKSISFSLDVAKSTTIKIKAINNASKESNVVTTVLRPIKDTIEINGKILDNKGKETGTYTGDWTNKKVKVSVFTNIKNKGKLAYRIDNGNWIEKSEYTVDKEGTTNFTDCLENANDERIEQLEREISKMEEMQKTCTSTTFLIRYYDDDKNVVLDSVAACTNQQIKFKSISKPGYTFKGWDFKYKSIGKEAFTTNMPYVISDDFLKSIEEKYGGFNLIPVWE